MKVTMLGSGTSSGVPRIGNDWGRCDPANPRNRRRRVALLVEAEGRAVLVDAGPDVREQLLDADVRHLDAVLFTHDHADHCHGIDDLRAVFHAMRRPLDVYAHEKTLAGITTRFRYVFDGRRGYPPTCTAHELPEALQVGPIRITWFPQRHGHIHSTGFVFESAAVRVVYSTDVDDLPDETLDHIAGADLWIVDALRREPHPSHAHLERTLDWIARVQPREAWLTHMDQSMDHDELLAELPPGVTPGYDNRVWRHQ